MISYEKAKELKDAGCPQGSYNDGDRMYIGQDPWQIPDTVELIAACGSGFETLHCSGIEWWAGIYNFHDGMWLDPLGRGSTYDEALANLYIALNKK